MSLPIVGCSLMIRLTFFVTFLFNTLLAAFNLAASLFPFLLIAALAFWMQSNPSLETSEGISLSMGVADSSISVSDTTSFPSINIGSCH